MPTVILRAALYSAKEDIYYNNFLIPKGALLINNIYTIYNNPNYYNNLR